MLLAAINPILRRWNLSPTEQAARLLEETYLMIVRSGLAALSADARSRHAAL
jgi:hypothetical protein